MEGDGEGGSELFADGFGVTAEHGVGVDLEGEVLEVDAVFFQRSDAFFEGVGDVDGVGGLGGACDADHIDAVPGLESFVDEFGEDPGVASVLGGVEGGEGGGAVVGEVEAGAAPGEVVVGGEDDFGAVFADGAGNVASEGRAVFDDTVGVVEELDGGDADGGGASTFFFLAEGADLVGVHGADAGFTAGDEEIDDFLALVGPAGDGAGGAVFEVVGVGGDG